MNQTLERATKSKVERQKDIHPNLQQKLVCEEILTKLGTIKDFYKVEASNVYNNKWRVDVWTKTWGEEDTFGPSYHIKHSYFCTVQDNCISNSVPEINEKNG